MNKRESLFLASVFMLLAVNNSVFSAGYTVKKANSVSSAASADSGIASKASGALGNNLVQTAITLGTGAMQISKQTKANTAECSPSGSEIKFINNMVLEVAKTGVTADEFNSKFAGVAKGGKCDTSEYQVTEEAILNGQTVQNRCFPTFDTNDDGAKYLVDGFYEAYSTSVSDPNSARNSITVSNAYDIWTVIADSYFSAEDLLTSEQATAIKLTEKADSCSSVKLSNKKKELWSNFALGIVGNIGNTTGTKGTGESLQMIQQLTQSAGGGGGKLNGILNVGSGFLGKIGQ